MPRAARQSLAPAADCHLAAMLDTQTIHKERES